jgi:hypothetical protein
MIAKCANPDCNIAFRYLRGGKLFLLDIPNDSPRDATHRREYFWLCDQCSATMKVVVNKSGEAAISGLPGPGPNLALRPAV